MQGQGFAQVYNLSGGIKAWDGLVASGPEVWGLDLTDPGEGPAGVLATAHGLEHCLKVYYQTLAERGGEPRVVELFAKLAQIEQAHEKRLREMYVSLSTREQAQASLEQTEPVRMEGGYSLEEFLERSGEALRDREQVLMLAMSLEAQALDLYMRLADRAKHQASKEVLLSISGEEQAHLTALGTMLTRVQAAD